MTDAEAKRLGRLIGEARRKQGLSYGELGALSETDKGWLHRLENGQRADPDPALLTRVAEALGIDPARIDRVSGDHLAASLPNMRVYLRSKGKLSLEDIKQIEGVVAELRAERAHPSDGRTSDAKAGAP